MATSQMTAVTPIRMPSMASPDRSLCSKSDLKPKRRTRRKAEIIGVVLPGLRRQLPVVRHRLVAHRHPVRRRLLCRHPVRRRRRVRVRAPPSHRG